MARGAAARHAIRPHAARRASPTDDKRSQPTRVRRAANTGQAVKVRFLLDEHIPPTLKAALLRREPTLDVLCIGDPGAPSLGTPDPEILRFLENTQRALVTRNRRSMWQHLEDHWQNGGHVWGVFWVRRSASLGKLIKELLLIWGASEAKEWLDQLRDIPLV